MENVFQWLEDNAWRYDIEEDKETLFSQIAEDIQNDIAINKDKLKEYLYKISDY